MCVCVCSLLPKDRSAQNLSFICSHTLCCVAAVKRFSACIIYSADFVSFSFDIRVGGVVPGDCRKTSTRTSSKVEIIVYHFFLSDQRIYSEKP